MNATASPLSGSERIAVVDVLRAYALFGIIISHSVTGFLAGQQPSADFMQFTALDRAVVTFDQLFTFGKFYTIFSFLFGLSFAIQLGNAQRKGAGFAGRFSWRLLVLLLIAIAHGAFFSGDVLIIYAILGLLLIPFRNVSTRKLLVTAAILVFNVPGMLLGAALLGVVAASADAAAAADGQAMEQQFAAAALHAYQVKQSGTLPELFQVTLTQGLVSKLGFVVISGRLWITFGLFLLGMVAGRLELFRDTEANRAFFRRLLKVSAPFALVTTVIAGLFGAPIMAATVAEYLVQVSFTIQQISLSALYVAAVTLLFWRSPAKGLLPALAPAGRMGLTTYLSQTAFGVLLFYGLGGIGFGLIGKVGAATAAGAAIAFYVLQIFIAQAWAKKFRIGPAEWLWRSITYFKPQPLLLQGRSRSMAEAA